MYNVSPTVLEKLKPTFSLQSKLSDVIYIFDTPQGLEFFAKNSSLTVSSRAFFGRHMFENFGSTSKVYCVSSSALDKIFSSIPQGFADFSLEFKDRIHLDIVYKKVHRSHEIDLIDAPDIERGPPEIIGRNAYIIRAEMLRDVLTHFSAAAEIAELYIETGESVRWRGYRNPQRAGKTEIFTKIDSTAMMHFTDMFVGLRVDAPWRSEFLLKELRYANLFFEKVSRECKNEITCLFGAPGEPMHLCCAGQNEAFSLQFQTLAKNVPQEESKRFTWQFTPESVIIEIPSAQLASIDASQQPESPEETFPAPPPKRTKIVKVSDSLVDSVSEDSVQNEENVAMAFPLAEIESTQQERVPGLFD